MGPSITK